VKPIPTIELLDNPLLKAVPGAMRWPKILVLLLPPFVVSSNYITMLSVILVFLATLLTKHILNTGKRNACRILEGK